MRQPNRFLVFGTAALLAGILAAPSILDAGHRRAYRHGWHRNQCCVPVSYHCCGSYGHGHAGYYGSSQRYGSYGDYAADQQTRYSDPAMSYMGETDGGAVVPPPPAGQVHEQPDQFAQEGRIEHRSLRPDFDAPQSGQQMQQRIDELETENQRLRQELDRLRSQLGDGTHRDHTQRDESTPAQPPASPQDGV